MARTQEPRLAAGLIKPWRFIVARYKRLWPMMAAGSLLGIPLLYLRTPTLGEFGLAATANLLLLPYFWSTFAFPLNIPAWTIFCELVMNALHVLGLWRLRGIWLWAGVLLLLPVVESIGAHHGSLDVGARPETLFWGVLRTGFAYLYGIALARWWRDAPPIKIPPFLAILIMPLLLPLAWWLRIDRWWFDLVFITFACPLMIAGALRQRAFAGISRRLGQLAFPLFALQMPILQGLHETVGGYWTGAASALGAGILGAFLAEWLGRWRRTRKAQAQIQRSHPWPPVPDTAGS